MSSGRALSSALLLACLPACGSQFTDPILDEQPPQVECPQQYVAQFDGASYASAARLIQDDFTIEAWIQSTSSASGGGFAEGTALVFADVETVMVNDFASAILNGKFVMEVGGPDTMATSSSDVITGQWVHVAATRQKKNGVVLVFVDGVLEGSAVGNTNPLGDAATINIGGRAGRNFFTGLMSDVRLWNVARSQADLVANMHERLSGDEAGLVSYYRLDETSGASAHDSSPSANDAAVTGMLQWLETDSPFCEP